jgi:iron complex transport system ATP-binding protein
MIAARHISVSLGRRRIVEDVDLVAASGEVTVIVGPNGSGKSTLMRALCNELPYDGEVTINGADIRRLRAYELAARRAVLPQASTLTFPFTVHEVVRLGLTHGYAGLAPEAARHLPQAALERVDLKGFGGRYFGELSGGEQQRVHLARVLCQVWRPVLDGAPRFLLLDEPVSSLDIRHQLLVMRIAREFAAGGGGVIAILHDLNLAAMFADKVLAMHEGRAAGFGTPAEVLRDDLIARVFGCDLKVGEIPAASVPFVLPQSARIAEAVS